MTNRNIIITIILLFSFSTAVYADKKPEKHHDEPVEQIEPDAIPQQPKTDVGSHAPNQPFVHYDSGLGISGFDISHYQGHINWDQLVQDENAGFMYIKASEGSGIQDNMYQRNFAEAKRVGFKVGSYHFFRATASAHEQFKNFISMVKKEDQDLLPIIDVETIGRGVTMYTFHERLTSLLRLVEMEFGKRPLIYTGLNFYNKYLYGAQYRGYKFMIASYSFEEPILQGNDDFLLWQYTGHGSARGVRGHIDISRFVRGHTIKEIYY